MNFYQNSTQREKWIKPINMVEKEQLKKFERSLAIIGNLNSTSSDNQAPKINFSSKNSK
jgi:hypothetical protein